MLFINIDSIPHSDFPFGVFELVSGNFERETVVKLIKSVRFQHGSWGILDYNPITHGRGHRCVIFDVDDLVSASNEEDLYQLIGRKHYVEYDNLIGSYHNAIQHEIYKETSRVTSETILKSFLYNVDYRILGFNSDINVRFDDQRQSIIVRLQVEDLTQSMELDLNDGDDSARLIESFPPSSVRIDPLYEFFRIYCQRNIELSTRYIYTTPNTFNYTYDFNFDNFDAYRTTKHYTVEAEKKAKETLKKLVGEKHFKTYEKENYVKYTGDKFIYRIYSGNTMTECYDKKSEKLIEKRCLVIPDVTIPPTDSLITRLLLLKSDENEFMEKAIKWEVYDYSIWRSAYEPSWRETYQAMLYGNWS